MTALALQSFRLDWLNLQSSLEYRWNVSTQVSKYKEFELGLNPTCRIPLVPSLLLDLPLISFTRIGVKALRAQHLSVAFYQRPEEQICYLLWVSPRRPNIRNVILKSDPKPEPSFLPLCFPLQTLFLPLSFPLQNSLVAAPVHKDVYPGGRGGGAESFSHVPQESSWLVVPHDMSHLTPAVPIRWCSLWWSCSFDMWTDFSLLLLLLQGPPSCPLFCHSFGSSFISAIVS